MHSQQDKASSRVAQSLGGRIPQMTLGCTGRWTGQYLTVIILMEELASSHRLRALDLALSHVDE